MGHFSPEEPILSGARRIITASWRRQREEFDHPGWENLFGTGLVESETTYAWRDEVWVPEQDLEEDLDDNFTHER